VSVKHTQCVCVCARACGCALVCVAGVAESAGGVGCACACDVAGRQHTPTHTPRSAPASNPQAPRPPPHTHTHRVRVQGVGWGPAPGAAAQDAGGGHPRWVGPLWRSRVRAGAALLRVIVTHATVRTRSCMPCTPRPRHRVNMHARRPGAVACHVSLCVRRTGALQGAAAGRRGPRAAPA
jgi:hypothetical protein